MGLGHGPAKRSTNSNPVSHTKYRPVRAPAQGRQREEQANPPPPKKRNKQTAQKGGNPRPTTSARPPEKKGGGQETDTQPRSCAPTHERRAEPPAMQHQRQHPRGPPKEHQRTIQSNPATDSREQRATGGEDTPDTPAHTPPEKLRATGKEKHRRNHNEEGRGNGDQEAQDRDRQRQVPQSQDTTGPRPNPPQGSPKKCAGVSAE